MMKTCRTCEIEKDVDEFHTRGGKRKHLKRSACKLCGISKSKEWRKTASYNEVQKKYRKKRYAIDPAFRVKILSRTRLYRALKAKGVKPARTMELVGCTAEELVAYLQKLVPEGADLNQFHIDHIRPCASFDFMDPEEVRKCFHFTNLQPLSPQANMSKGAKY